jgi:ATP-dependent Lon protease
MNEQALPLFPLQVVLFPNSALPLHIFEERYQILINRSIAGRSEFGINLAERTVLSPVGCTAMVRDVVQRYEDGRMDIVVVGGRRYKLLRYEASTAPYLIGSVLFLENTSEEVDTNLKEEAVSLYNKLVEIVYRNDERLTVRSEDSRHEVSFRMAQKAGMDLATRQKLLELDSENRRLALLREYLTQVLPKVERAEEVDRVVRSDGYL